MSNCIVTVCDLWFFTWNMCFKIGHGMYFCYWSIHGSSCIWNFTHFYRLSLFSFLINCVCCGYSVMINHTGTGCDFIVSIFPYENWIFSCEILQGALIFFSNKIVFNKTYPKFIHSKYLILTPFSLFSYASIFHVKIKVIMWNSTMCINILQMKYLWNIICRACVMQHSTQYLRIHWR